MKFSLVIKRFFKLLFDHRPITNITVKIALLPPNELLNGRCALVTGGTSGIGYAIAKAYINAGAAVIITGRSKERINAAINRLKIECSEATVFGCVLNNTQVPTFEKTFIASASCIRPADSAYTVSKWGIRGLTLGLAKTLAKYGITVNGIAPGPTATPMMIKDGQSNMWLERLPLGRYIMPEEIANMAVYLVSDMGRSIMGDMIYMTGGAGVLTYDDVKYSF